MRFPFRVKLGHKENFYKMCVKNGLDLAFTFSYSCDENRKMYPNSCIAAESVLNLPVYSRLTNNDLETIKKVIKKTELHA